MVNADVTGDACDKEVTMEVYETYSSVLVALSIALLLITAGIGKRKLEWKPRRVVVRSRRTQRSRISRGAPPRRLR